MSKFDVKPLPFSVDRTSAVALTDQVCDGFKRAIISGYYREGDYLPPFQVISRELGVSMRIPREAIERLAADNFVSPRPRVGSLVLPRNGIVRRGMIIAILPAECEGSYYPSVFIGELRRRLLSAGWLFTCVTLDCRRGRRHDLSLLEDVLSLKIDFAIPVYCPAAAIRMLVRKGVPILEVGNGLDNANGRDHFYCSFARASEALVRHCELAGVRSMTIFEYGNGARFYPALVKSRIKFEIVRIELCAGPDYLAEIKRTTAREVLRRFGGPEPRLPDALFFADDYIADGALVALAALGISMPEDVKVVVMSNRGWGPVSVKELTRIEVDPAQCGRVAAAEVLRRIKNPEHHGEVTVEASYVIGETFPLGTLL